MGVSVILSEEVMSAVDCLCPCYVSPDVRHSTSCGQSDIGQLTDTKLTFVFVFLPDNVTGNLFLQQICTLPRLGDLSSVTDI